MSGHLKKPRYGNPCNGCGFCCMLEVCAIGIAAHGQGTPAPCPSLVRDKNSYACGLVIAEEAYCEATNEPRRISEALGVGKGCDSSDAPLEVFEWNTDMKAGKFSEIKTVEEFLKK